jgi:HEAT repeat protein
MPRNTIADKILDYLKQEETDYAAAAQLGEAALPILKSIIEGNNEALASKAASLAGMIGGAGGTEALVEAAKHPSEIVRVAAAAASRQLLPSQSEMVLEHLIDDADIGVAKYTLQSIKAKKLSAHFEPKLREMSDKHPQEGIKAMAKSLLQ